MKLLLNYKLLPVSGNTGDYDNMNGIKLQVDPGTSCAFNENPQHVIPTPRPRPRSRIMPAGKEKEWEAFLPTTNKLEHEIGTFLRAEGKGAYVVENRDRPQFGKYFKVTVCTGRMLRRVNVQQVAGEYKLITPNTPEGHSEEFKAATLQKFVENWYGDSTGDIAIKNVSVECSGAQPISVGGGGARSHEPRTAQGRTESTRPASVPTPTPRPQFSLSPETTRKRVYEVEKFLKKLKTPGSFVVRKKEDTGADSDYKYTVHYFVNQDLVKPLRVDRDHNGKYSLRKSEYLHFQNFKKDSIEELIGLFIGRSTDDCAFINLSEACEGDSPTFENPYDINSFD